MVLQLGEQVTFPKLRKFYMPHTRSIFAYTIEFRAVLRFDFQNLKVFYASRERARDRQTESANKSRMVRRSQKPEASNPKHCCWPNNKHTYRTGFLDLSGCIAPANRVSCLRVHPLVTSYLQCSVNISYLEKAGEPNPRGFLKCNGFVPIV